MNQEPQRPAAAAREAEIQPLVTVIVTARNRESFIRECLNELMEQSVADRLEVVVVDQASEQAEAPIVADFQRRHGKVMYLRLGSATGAYAGVDLAARLASGRYLTILEAGDRLGTDACGLLAGALEHDDEAVLVYGDTCFTAVPHESLAKHTSYRKMVWPDDPEQLGRVAEVPPHPMWRREFHDTIGGFGDGDDALRDFILRGAGQSRFLHVPAFTGLKLIEAAGAPDFDAISLSPRELRAAPAQTAVSAVPQQDAEPSADEAFARIRPVVNGADYLEAVKALEKHLGRYPQHAIAHNDLGALSYRLGDKEKALRHYRLAVELAPEVSTYRKNLADILYVEEGAVDEAIGIYLELLKKAPRDVETLLNLGIISEGVGRPEEAETFYQRALEIEPSNQAVRESLAALRKRRTEAEAAAKEDDDPPEERYGKVQTLVAQGDVDAAVAALESILDAYPDFPPAHNDLAVLYHQQGNRDGALAHYEKAAALVPGNGTYQKNLADFYFVEGYDVDGAVAIYLDQLKKEPRNVDTLMNLGKICALLNRPQEAETFYHKVTQLEPWNQAARECLKELRRCANG